jgi:hypothetical protein
MRIISVDPGGIPSDRNEKRDRKGNRAAAKKPMTNQYQCRDISQSKA